MSRPWSYSRLNCYDTCPKQYAYKYVDNLPSARPPGKAAERGTAIHTKAEMYLRGEIPMYPPELQKVAAHAMMLKAKQATAEQKLAVTIEWKPTEWDAPDAYLRAILDINYKDVDTVHVQDWKTGKVYDSHKDQLNLYIAVIAAHVEGKEYIGRCVYIDEGNVSPPKVVAADRVKPIRLMIDGRIKNAEADTIFPTRSGMHCKWCDYSGIHYNGPCTKG